MEPRAFFRSLIRSAAISLAAFLAIVVSSAYLLVGPPFFTDDPEPIDYRYWEFYVASQQARDRDGILGTAPHFEINYGVALDMMLHLIALLNFNKPSGGRLTKDRNLLFPRHGQFPLRPMNLPA